MSRYLLLFLVNLPLAIAAVLSALTQYKLGRLSINRFAVQILLWTLFMLGLALAQPIYIWLFNSKLTNTEPLSLFDVIQITGIALLFYTINRTRSKLHNLERRMQDLHQELSIKLSAKK